MTPVPDPAIPSVPTGRSLQVVPWLAVLRGAVAQSAFCPHCRSSDLRPSRTEPDWKCRLFHVVPWRCRGCSRLLTLPQRFEAPGERGALAAVPAFSCPPCGRCGSTLVAPSKQATRFLREGYICLDCRRRFAVWPRRFWATVVLLALLVVGLTVVLLSARSLPRDPFRGDPLPRWRAR